MDDERAERLQDLAHYIAHTSEPLVFTTYLQIRGRLGYGFSMLGLVCAAHQYLTNEGRWIVSNRDVPELPDYMSGNEITDRYLPRSVIEYFGFRDEVASFYMGDVSVDVKRMMRKTKRTETSSLYRVGLDYPKRGKEIVSKIIRDTPPTLTKFANGPDEETIAKRLRDLKESLPGSRRQRVPPARNRNL